MKCMSGHVIVEVLSVRPVSAWSSVPCSKQRDWKLACKYNRWNKRTNWSKRYLGLKSATKHCYEYDIPSRPIILPNASHWTFSDAPKQVWEMGKITGAEQKAADSSSTASKTFTSGCHFVFQLDDDPNISFKASTGSNGDAALSIKIVHQHHWRYSACTLWTEHEWGSRSPAFTYWFNCRKLD